MDADGSGAAEASGSERTCPSGCCEEGALLLGVVSPDGTVGFVQPVIEVSREFVETARRHSAPPERRFRFAQPCVEHACAQWVDSRCSVIERVLSAQQAAGERPAEIHAVSLPPCGIRKTCRWFAQSGPSACGVCPLIVTDLRSG
jgi:hypothetical protein